jgi:hypothetical protein
MLRLNPFSWRVRDRILLPAMIAVYVVLTVVLPARAQVLSHVNLERVNQRLAGHVIDYTNDAPDRPRAVVRRLDPPAALTPP